MLVRCLYASRAVKPIGDHDLDAILTQSRRNNPRHGITGMLCFANGIFVQVLEGGRGEVSRLFSTIARDPRNTGIEILLFGEIIERRFSNWTMGQVNMGSVNPALLLKHAEKAELNPFSCSGEATLAMLLEIADSGAIVSRPN